MQTRTGVVAMLAAVVLAAAASGALIVKTLEVRYERDVSRMVFNDNVELLDDLRRRSGLEGDSLNRLLATSPEPFAKRAYLVVSIEDHRLWYRLGDSVLFTDRKSVV